MAQIWGCAAVSLISWNWTQRLVDLWIWPRRLIKQTNMQIWWSHVGAFCLLVHTDPVMKGIFCLAMQPIAMQKMRCMVWSVDPRLHLGSSETITHSSQKATSRDGDKFVGQTQQCCLHPFPVFTQCARLCKPDWYAISPCSIADPAGISMPQYRLVTWTFNLEIRHTCGSACLGNLPSTRRPAGWPVLDNCFRQADPQVYLNSEVNASKLRDTCNHMSTKSTAQKSSIAWKLMSASMP